MAVMKRQLASAHAEASKASAQAAAAQRSVDNAVQTLRGELASLRKVVEQRHQPDERPHSANTSAPAASMTRLAGVSYATDDLGQSAVQSSIAEVQQQLARLTQEVAQLLGREARQAAYTSTAAASVVGSLQQQVCAAQQCALCPTVLPHAGSGHAWLSVIGTGEPPSGAVFRILQLAVVRQDQQLMVGEMQRWKALLGSFAALAGGPGRAAPGAGGSEPASELASGWQPVSPAELMMEASNAPAPRGTMEGESVQRSGVLDPLHAPAPGHRCARQLQCSVITLQHHIWTEALYSLMTGQGFLPTMAQQLSDRLAGVRSGSPCAQGRGRCTCAAGVA